MSDVEKFALWVGLISSIVSIVLSIVATTFAVLVNNRSEKVSDETIRSLQKIESAVGRLSEDTSGLIKAAWDAMLGSVSGTVSRPSAGSHAAAHQIASGLASEVRSEIAFSGKDAITGEDTVARLSGRIEVALAKLQTAIEGQLKTQERIVQPAAILRKLGVLEGLSPLAQELARALLAGGHVSQSEYNSLEPGVLNKPVSELREAGLLIPLQGHDDTEGKLVYWFPPGLSKTLRSAFRLLPPASSSVRNLVKSELTRINYKVPNA